MDPNIPIGAAAIYAGVYLLIARNTLSELEQVDPEYWKWLDATSAIKRSVAVTSMLFDSHCPKSFWPDKTKRKFKIARAMLWLSPVVLVATFILTLI